MKLRGFDRRIAVIGIATVIFGSHPAAAQSPMALSTSFPNCGEIQQPKILTGTPTPDGVQYTWESKGPGAEYDYIVNRFVNGAWVREGDWGDAGSLTGLFVPWSKNGVTGQTVSLQIVQKCYGTAWGVPFRVNRSDVPVAAPATPTPTPSAPAATLTAVSITCYFRANNEIEVDEFQRTSCPSGWVPKIQCKNRKSMATKNFIRKTCPKGWQYVKTY